MLLTAKEIASILEITPTAVYNRKGSSEYIIGSCQYIGATGRPTKLYTPEVLELWGMNILDLLESKDCYEKRFYSKKKNRKNRSDRLYPRKIDTATENDIVELCRISYLNQRNVRGIRYSVYKTVEKWVAVNGLPHNYNSLKKFQHYIYSNRIVGGSKNTDFKGYANRKERCFYDMTWKEQFIFCNSKNQKAIMKLIELDNISYNQLKKEF